MKLMFYRKCKFCNNPMDPGEGRNGVCDDCITGETERYEREKQMERMVRATDWTQMEMEEFISGCKY